MNIGGESVGVVSECVFDRPEDLVGWRVGECLGHLACALFGERLEPFPEAADAGFAVRSRGRHRAIGVNHDGPTRGDLLHQQ